MQDPYSMQVAEVFQQPLPHQPGNGKSSFIGEKLNP